MNAHDQNDHSCDRFYFISFLPFFNFLGLFFDIHSIVSVTKIDFTKNVEVIFGVNQFLISDISYFDI